MVIPTRTIPANQPMVRRVPTFGCFSQPPGDRTQHPAPAPPPQKVLCPRRRGPYGPARQPGSKESRSQLELVEILSRRRSASKAERPMLEQPMLERRRLPLLERPQRPVQKTLPPFSVLRFLRALHTQRIMFFGHVDYG